MGLNLGGKPKGSRKTEHHSGTFEDMIKQRAAKTPEILKEIEHQFEDYAGGGVAIVINTYDENGDCDGHKVAIMGVDKPQGLIKLAKGLHTASEEVIENLAENSSPAAMLEAAMEMMKEIQENLNDKKN